MTGNYTGNYYCDICIDIITWWSRNTPLSYGAINILLFVIIQPLLICLYFVTIMVMTTKKEKLKETLVTISTITFVISLIGVFLLIFLPVFNIMTDMKY